MSFQDLPADWPTRPVTDPDITADLLDLVVRDSDRATGAVAILICGPTGRLVRPVVVTLPPGPVDGGERRRAFDAICGVLVAEDDPRVERLSNPGILVALARPGPALMTADDRRWRNAAARSCEDHAVDLLGAWLVTPGVIRRMPLEQQRRPA